MSYSKGIVYKIICNLDSKFIYIGSTFNELRHRFQEHKRKYKFWLNNRKGSKCSCFDYFQKYGIDNFSIIKIKEYICYRSHKLDTKQLHAYEQLWLNKTPNCCNKLSAFNPLWRENEKIYHENNKEKKKEYDKEYCEKNKEKRNEHSKEYRKNNKEIISEKKKEYNYENKEQIKEKASQKITCDICGAMITKYNIARHQKSNKCILFSNK